MDWRAPTRTAKNSTRPLLSRIALQSWIADDVLAHTSLSILYQRKGMVPEAEAEAAKARVLGWKQQLKAGKTQQP